MTTRPVDRAVFSELVWTVSSKAYYPTSGNEAGFILIPQITICMQKEGALYIKVVTFAVFLGILANGFGNLLWLTAHSNHPTFPPITKHLIAGLIEPITTKLIPVVSVVAYARFHRTSLQRYVSARFVRLAVLFGLLAGLVEFALYLFKAILLSFIVVIPFAEFLRCRFPPVLMHTVTGTLVTLPVLSIIGYSVGDSIVEDIPLLSEHYPKFLEVLKDRLFLTIISTTLGILFAQLFHVWWNTGGGDVVAQFLKLPC